MYEIVDRETREHIGYFMSIEDAKEELRTEAVEYWEAEIWQVADDAPKTRVLLVHPRLTETEVVSAITGLTPPHPKLTEEE